MALKVFLAVAWRQDGGSQINVIYDHILTGLDYNVGSQKTALNNYNYFVICNNYISLTIINNMIHIYTLCQDYIFFMYTLN